MQRDPDKALKAFYQGQALGDERATMALKEIQEGLLKLSFRQDNQRINLGGAAAIALIEAMYQVGHYHQHNEKPSLEVRFWQKKS